MRLRWSTLLSSSLSAALVGFVIHVGTREVLRDWVARQMHGVRVRESIDVLVPAAITSLEIGFAVTLIYILVRPVIGRLTTLWRCLVFWFLILGLQGRLIRQPLMDFIVGNPWEVVIVQNGAVWVTWLAIVVAVVLIIDRFQPSLTGTEE